MPYVNTSRDDMLRVFMQDKGWAEQIAFGEYAYEREMRKAPGLFVVVYSGVRVGDNQGRGVGRDAIRVCVVDRRNPNMHRGFIKSRRVNRVKGWQDRVRERVLQVMSQAEARVRGEKPLQKN